jgi:T5SS/PEP-CTERM-associated repeat protein
MNGGTVNLRNILRIARGQNAAAEGTLNLLGGNFNTGDGVVVARGNAGNPATGNFTIGGTTGKFVAGNSMGEGNAAGERIEGFFSVANSIGTTGNVTVRDSGVVKALRFTGRQGTGNITVQDNGQFHVVNDLGAGTGTAGTLYGSFLGGGAASNGDGPEGITGSYTLTLRGNGLLDVNASAQGRDPGRPDLQGFILARGNSQASATVQDSAQLVVRQRFIIGGLGSPVDGQPVNLNGPNGQRSGGANPEGTATVTVTGGTVSADHLIVGGSGNGTLNASGGTVRTQAYAATFDPDGGATSSVNAIRIGMLETSTGTMNVSGNATVTTGGELGIGHYGSGTLKVTGGAASIQAKDVFVQKQTTLAPDTSKGKVVAQITGATHTPIRATDSVTINGGRIEVDAASTPPATGARVYDILVADSDANGTGTVTGTFSEKSVPPDDAQGRRWSVLYEEKKVSAGLARPGDANFDSAINGSDFALLAQNFGRSADRTWRQGDFNDDRAVNGTDFALLAGNFGRVYGLQAGDVTASDWAALESFGAQIGVPVPEPVALPALALGGLLLLRRRRVSA